MLDFLRRHHKTFWIVVTVVVIISFTFWGATTKTGNSGRGSPDDAAVTIYGRDYSHVDVERLIRYREVCVRLGMYDFARTLSSVAQRFSFKDRTPLDFALNLLVLRNEMEKNGVRVSDADAKEAFRRLPVFQSKEGGFDGPSASKFEEDLGSYGFRADDVYTLMRDSIGLQKLQEIVSGNVVATNGLAERIYAANYQSIKASSIPFAADDFKKTAKVSDEEIKKYFDQNKDKFQSQPKRAVSYVFFEKPKDLDKKTQEERNNFGKLVTDFSADTIKEPTKFEALAKAQKMEVHTVPLFSEDSPPEALKEEQTLIEDIFTIDRKTHPVSDPVEGKNGYFIYSVTNSEEPRQQELKEVQDKVREFLVNQKAQENMMKAASDTRKKLEEAIKAGKKFEEAAKANGVQPQAITEFSPAETPKDLSNGREIAQEAQMTPPGAFTKPLSTENGVIIVFVQSKVLYKSDQGATRRQSIGHSMDSYTQNDVFRAWFDRRRDEANAVPHLRNLQQQ